MFENIAKIPTLPYLLSGAQYLADQMQLDTGKFFSAALPTRLKRLKSWRFWRRIH